MRTWYKRYLGYCFCDKDGREVILTDIFHFVDENGKPTGTGYEVFYPDTNESYDMDYRTFKSTIADYTRLPQGRRN